MLTINIPDKQYYDEAKAEIFIVKGRQNVQLEHSLLSISKWEAKWHIPFLNSSKTREQTLDYIFCMVISPSFDKSLLGSIQPTTIREIKTYIDDSRTATTFNIGNNENSREIVTSELIYYWMIRHNIPIECQKWHINRLLTLITICNIKANPNKMDRRSILSENVSLNEQRRKLLNTKG